MELFPTHIILSGSSISIEKLLQEKDDKSGWEKEWMDFLEEWYAPSDYIEVTTSGSTGNPKTICLKKDFVAASALRTIRHFHLNENDKILHCLPSRYIAGKLMVVRALIGKLDLHVVDPTTNFDFLQHIHFKFAAMVPNQVLKLLQLKKYNIELLLIGGAAIPQQLEKSLKHISTVCYSSYGMTETATHIALRKLNGKSADEYYHCLGEIQVKLSSDNCLQIYMSGLEHDFLQTTDLAELKDGKTFMITGRSDHMIISGGIKFSPEKLEHKLEAYMEHPFIVSSLPHETLGQQLILVIEGIETPETIAHVNAICKKHLSKYEQAKQIIFVKKLPRTPNGKLNRTGLKRS